jgi:hypothetical protein
MNRRVLASLICGVFFAMANGLATAQQIPTSSATASPSPVPTGALTENPAISALASRWVQHLQSRPPADLRAMTIQDGPVLVVAAGVLAGQGDPITVKYAGGSPPNDRVPLYTYLYDFHFEHSNVREILMVDGAGNVHQVLFVSDHPMPL